MVVDELLPKQRGMMVAVDFGMRVQAMMTGTGCWHSCLLWDLFVRDMDQLGLIT